LSKNVQKGFILMCLTVNRAILSMTADDRPKSGRVRAKTCLTGQRDQHLSVSYFKPCLNSNIYVYICIIYLLKLD